MKKINMFIFFCLAVVVVQANSWDWAQMGGDINGDAGDRSGSNISISSDGQTVVIGSPGYDNGKGRVRVYEWNSGSSDWVQKGSIIVGNGVNQDRFGGNVSISSGGDTVAIGASGADSWRGEVEVWRWNTTEWVQLGNNLAGEASGDNFGCGVSLSSDGGILAVGAKDAGGSGEGEAYVYEWSGTSWVQMGADLTGDAWDDGFGFDVNLSSDGEILAVGMTGVKSVRLFEWNSGTATWVQKGSTIDGEAWGTGQCVCLSSNGNILAFGSPFYDSDRGRVRVYEWNSTDWVQKGGDNMIGDTQDSELGKSVSITSDGLTVVAGAYDWDNGKGQVKVFEWNSGSSSWEQKGSNINGMTEDDDTGGSVGISDNGEIIAIGIPGKDDNGYASGQVQVYQWAPPTPIASWAIYIGIIMIVAFTVYRFRRMFY